MLIRLFTAVCLLAVAGAASAARWEIEITNVTPGQTFTPILAASHYGGARFFEPGAEASAEIQTLAEAGNTGPLAMALASLGKQVTDTDSTAGLLGPGQTATLHLQGRPGQRLSLAGMLIPTNDTFVGVDGVFLPIRGTTTIEALAYDAGSEANDQNCLNIPGPRCMGSAESPPADTDEGFIQVSNGFHALPPADAGEVLTPAHYDWSNPVALIRVRRIW